MDKAQLENSLKDMQEQLEHAKKVYIGAALRGVGWGVGLVVHLHSKAL